MGRDIDTSALEEYVNDFSASRHFFVSYKNMLEYDQNSIEKAYILSYVNPSPGNANQWSLLARKSEMPPSVYKFFVYAVAMFLKLPRAVHYLFIYIVLVIILTGMLTFSQNITPDGPYLLLISLVGLLTLLFLHTYQ